jgi:hypothetical protein
MSVGELARPLLLQGGGQDVEQAAELKICDIAQLFKEHPHDSARYLKAQGIVRLGEFEAPVGQAAAQ